MSWGAARRPRSSPSSRCVMGCLDGAGHAPDRPELVDVLVEWPSEPRSAGVGGQLLGCRRRSVIADPEVPSCPVLVSVVACCGVPRVWRVRSAVSGSWSTWDSPRSVSVRTNLWTRRLGRHRGTPSVDAPHGAVRSVESVVASGQPGAELGSGVNAQLAVDPGDVGLDGLLADERGGRDLAV